MVAISMASAVMAATLALGNIGAAETPVAAPVQRAVADEPSPPVTTSVAPAMPVAQADAAAPTTVAQGGDTAAATSDEILVSGHRRPAIDPLQTVNKASFEATAAVDKAVMEPVAMGYARIAPKPLRLGIRHVLSNLREPVTFLNYLLQLKPGKAFQTLGRFAINSTVGLGGLMDVARRGPFCLARRHNGFANTLAFYGVGPGPFFYVPLIGPTTLRDMFGGSVDRVLMPMAVGKPFGTPGYVMSTGTLSTLDRRIRNHDRIATLREAADPYVASRAAYLDRRWTEIEALHGRGDPMYGASLSDACLAKLARAKAKKAKAALAMAEAKPVPPSSPHPLPEALPISGSSE